MAKRRVGKKWGKIGPPKSAKRRAWMKKIAKKRQWMIGKIILILALAPIWRDPGWEGGVSAVEAVYNLATKPQKEHISVEEALRLAQEAYQKYR